MVAVLRTEGLTKTFGALMAVKALDLEVQEGDIFGFLGLNGAGKTTTLRMVLRLIRPDMGRVHLFGKDTEDSFLDSFARIGALVESPSLYPYLTGRKNLELLGRLSGGVDAARVQWVLEEVGLAARADSRVRTYSQGMRQRLGIAQALVHRPKLVFLDEPTNGLDPHGITDMRKLIGRLAKEEGITFVISSHLLYEVELICNRIAVLREGGLAVQGEVTRLLAEAGGRVRLVARPAEVAKRVLLQRGFSTLVEGDDGAFEFEGGRDGLGALNAALVAAGAEVSELAPRALSLEEYFVRLHRTEA